jgi:predicted PurR-regulated permease PerM
MTQPSAAILLLIWSVAVAMLDSLLRPVLIRRGVNLSMLLILAGVLGGMFAFGIVGLFVGPVILAVASTLLEAWMNEPAPVVVVDAAQVDRVTTASNPKDLA